MCFSTLSSGPAGVTLIREIKKVTAEQPSESVRRAAGLTGLLNAAPKVWVEAYGCSASIADAEMIKGLLKSGGYELADLEGDSSVNLIVTCSVKDVTEHRMLHRIKKLEETGKPLVVAGCLPKADKNRVESLSRSASLLGPGCIQKAVEVVDAALSGQKRVALERLESPKTNIPRMRYNPVVSIVQIASGCMSKCTFCQTKLAKGWLQSYRIGDIVRQVRYDLEDGCKEIWLSSTDNGCYGADIGSDLVELLESCCSIEGDFKIRLGMLNPMYLPRMLDILLEVFCRSPKMFKFIHVPVQSGSDTVLRAMKRGHSSAVFRDAVEAFRRRLPEFTVSTDVIVGFPSETQADFQETLDLLNETTPDIINLSGYCPRPGTESSKMKNLDSSIIKQRTRQAHVVARANAMERNSLWRSWSGEIVVDEIGRTIQGRNYAYKSVVLSSRPSGISLGTKISVKITGFSNYSLLAKPIN